jgi:hypothetical protein
MKIGLQVLHRALCKGRIYQHRLLTDLTHKAIYTLILDMVRILIYPYVEVKTQDSLIWYLTDISALLNCDTLLARHTLIRLYIYLREEILAL